MANPCWYKARHDFWFHYTRPENAEEIARTGLFIVPSSSGRCGLYVTEIQPGEISQRDLLIELFALQRDPINVCGVVILRRKRLVPLEEDRLGKHRILRRRYLKKLYPRSAGDVLDLTLDLVGYGRLDGRSWLFNGSVYP